MPSIAYESLLAAGTPQPAARFDGFPPFNLLGGHNDPSMVPVEALAEAAGRVLREQGASLAFYSAGHGGLGHGGLRRAVAGKLSGNRGITDGADELLITSGSLQGLELVIAALIEPGDTVLVEAQSYAGTIARLRKAGAQIVGIPLDEDGMRTDRLEASLAELAAKGVRPKLIYTIPTIQNPTGSVLPMDRRRALLDLSARYAVPIVEDECYADLLWQGDWPPSLRGMPGGGDVIHIGSFSKTIAPALRLGYIAAPWAVTSRLLALKSDGGTPAIEQMVVADLLERHFEEHVRRLKERLRGKLAVLVEALAEQFGATADLMVPKGGIFLWLRLPDAVDTTQLAAAAAKEGIAFNAGSEWCVDADSGRHWLRICFGSASEAELREGVARLAAICHRETGIPARGGNVVRSGESEV